MTDCPQCHRAIEISEINHGTLFTCPLCNAVYFVGWDGQPELPPTAEEMAAENPVSENLEYQLNADGLPEASPFASDSGVFSESQAGASDPDATMMAFTPMENSGHETIIDNSDYQGSDYDSLDQAAASLEEEVHGEVPAMEPEVPAFESNIEEQAEETPYDFNQPLDQVQSSTSDTPDFKDVNDFANSDQETSALTYSLTISGIDSGKIHGDLRDALADSRFGWDAADMMKSIQGGTLTIRRLNPAKTFVLINRVKYLSVQISWRQDVLAAP